MVQKTLMKLKKQPYSQYSHQQTQRQYSGSQKFISTQSLRSRQSGILLPQQEQSSRRVSQDFLLNMNSSDLQSSSKQEFVAPRNSFIMAQTAVQLSHRSSGTISQSPMSAAPIMTTSLNRTSQEFEFIPPRNSVTAKASTKLHPTRNNSVMMTPTGPQPLHRLSQDNTSLSRRNSGVMTPGGIKFKFVDFDITETKDENIFPNGIKIEKSQYQHYAVKFLWRGNFLAPVRELMTRGIMVLDIGCGDANWIFDMAKDYPNSQFIGVDTQSDLTWKTNLTNVYFNEFDILKHGLPYKDGCFDYVHGRFLGTLFTEREYRKKVIEESIRVTKPGGTIELLESDFRWTNEGPALRKLLDGYREMLESKDINPHLSPNIGRYLRDTGNVIHIQTETRLLPLGRWGGRLGEIASEAVKDGLEDAKISLSQSTSMSSTEYNLLCMEAILEFDEYNVSMPTVRWYCTKRQPKRTSLFVYF
ncbi:2940_t:CDS:2 [Ambispora gerdemannii]|uniref:2940_t:CDS:1 n=1 Tax=Ambispora gerdemannii TaxID=144530 RepID=A0A9N8Z3D8_9GLOM|nr:2940_t:CDS:2 [Ambispora gerdemannii]